MKLLAIDCSTEACSAALSIDGELACEQFELAAREHTQRLLPMVDSLLQQAGISLTQVDAIAFGRGPGSFTGLRVCLGAVQGLAFGADLPVVPVSTLAALAQTAIADQSLSPPPSARLVSVLDARMDEVYWGHYRISDGLAIGDGAEQLSAPERLVVAVDGDGPVIAVGSGWRYADRIPGAARVSYADGELLPRASAVAILAERDARNGKLCRADKALPSYLRDEVAWKKPTR